MWTREQLEADVAFWVKRGDRCGSFGGSENRRAWGISSNSLVAYAYGTVALRPPSDWWDYAACVRAVRSLPRHRRSAALLEILAGFKQMVRRKYPNKPISKKRAA